METVTLQIALPIELYNDITKITNHYQLNELILDAINVKIHTESKKLYNSLKAGYIASKSEDEKLISDFEFADVENWDYLE